jgi:hypothetical protein
MIVGRGFGADKGAGSFENCEQKQMRTNRQAPVLDVKGFYDI